MLVEEELAAKCLNNRAACACQLQLYSQAIADTSRVLKKTPTDAKALMRRESFRLPNSARASRIWDMPPESGTGGLQSPIR